MKFTINLSKIFDVLKGVYFVGLPLVFLWYTTQRLALENAYDHAAIQIAIHQAEALGAIAQATASHVG